MGYVSDAGVLFPDAEGELQVTERIKRSGPVTARVWKTGRPTIGNVSVVSTALPQRVWRDTKHGTALDLRVGQGGLIGSGMAFLGAPPNEPEGTILTTLRWDMSKSPKGTLAAWSMGDGEGPFEIATKSLLGIASGVQEAYSAVEPLHRMTSPDDYMRTDEADVFNMSSTCTGLVLRPLTPYHWERIFRSCSEECLLSSETEGTAIASSCGTTYSGAH
ncbi:hypothetical protein THAR02_06154 [Trichoderma harzianum]|uniref:Uncharacterized protein n=1 Tax=Trichoderma harzianum TaxID=5544 RepID=A0A0F9XNA1_TRIHA|nr:hypothetical protein THAR02_06154 [Trichoderma harzianum]